MDIDGHYWFEELFTCKYMLMSNIAALLDLQHQITTVGKAIPGVFVAHALALSLPKTPIWDIVKVQLLQMKPLTSSIVSSTLQAEANWHAHNKPGGATAYLLLGRQDMVGRYMVHAPKVMIDASGTCRDPSMGSGRLATSGRSNLTEQ